jgi:hypothetical protein
MTAPINPPDLDTALKSLWGARELPFGAAVEKPYASDTFNETRHRLEQLVAVRACGLLHGPNGVGKTLLIQHFLKSQMVGLCSTRPNRFFWRCRLLKACA